MTLLFAAGVGVVFGCGAYLLMETNLLRVIVGLILVSNAANLALMAAGLRRGAVPVAPFDEQISDALTQAMTLTALVIGLAVIALLLAMVLRIHDGQGTIDFGDLRRAEEEAGEAEPVADVGEPEETHR